MPLQLPVYCFTCTNPTEVVNYLARDKIFISSIKSKIKKNFIDDLLQDLFIIFLTEIPENKVMELNQRGEVIIFAYGILKNKFDSTNKNTKPYKLYRNYQWADTQTLAEKIIDLDGQKDIENKEREAESIEEKQKQLSSALTKLDLQDKTFWYKWQILTEYIEKEETFEQFAKRTGIQIYSIKWAARKAKEKVLNELKNQNGNV